MQGRRLSPPSRPFLSIGGPILFIGVNYSLPEQTPPTRRLLQKSGFLPVVTGGIV
jgi:hypothetical protein